jgi:hypothetical protein
LQDEDDERYQAESLTCGREWKSDHQKLLEQEKKERAKWKKLWEGKQLGQIQQRVLGRGGTLQRLKRLA